MAISEKLQKMICNMDNSQLQELLEFVENELRLSETSIAEGMEIRK